MRDLGVDVRNRFQIFWGLKPKAATQPSKYR